MIGVAGTSTVTVTWAQPLVHPDGFFARAKNVVVAFRGPVLAGDPVANGCNCPPQLPVNQSTVSPALTVAESVEHCPAQIVDGVAMTLVGVEVGAHTVNDQTGPCTVLQQLVGTTFQ